MNIHMDTAEWLKSIVQEEGCMDSSSSLSGRSSPAPARRRPWSAASALNMNSPLNAPAATPPTPSSATTTTTASLSQDTSAKPAAGIGPREAPSATSLLVVAAGRTRDRGEEARHGDPPGATGAPLNPLPSYPGLQLPHLGSLAGNAHGLALMECMLEGHGAVDGGEFGAVLRNPGNLLFMGGGATTAGGGRSMGSFGDMNHGFLSSTFHGGSPPGFSMDGGHSGVFMEACQSMAINPVETKPHEKLLSLEWQQDQGCADVGRDGFYYPAGVGLWGGMMNSHGSSASNPLV